MVPIYKIQVIVATNRGLTNMASALVVESGTLNTPLPGSMQVRLASDLLIIALPAQLVSARENAESEGLIICSQFFILSPTILQQGEIRSLFLASRRSALADVCATPRPRFQTGGSASKSVHITALACKCHACLWRSAADACSY
jgi:hypothetical protein